VSNKLIITACLLAFLCNCSEPKQLSWEAYQKWLTKHSDQLIKKKEINAIEVTVRYLPSDLLAYRDIDGGNTALNQNKFDSVRAFYNCGLHFQLVIEADPKSKNLMYFKIQDQDGYTSRVEELSFHAENFVSLDNKGLRSPIVLSHYEGYNELQNKITLHLVFSPEWFTCGKFSTDVRDFTINFDDPYWEMGLIKFKFTPEFIRQIPTLKL
jgi:hypothetical protein